jgi:hypothetical protein
LMDSCGQCVPVARLACIACFCLAISCLEYILRQPAKAFRCDS